MAYTTINKGSSYFNTKLYTGTGASLANTGVGFQPDWVWIKGRSGATDHGLYDAVRGVQKDLVSNATSAETTQTTGLTAFGSDGFTVGALAKLNTSAATYVAWNWLGANTTASNTNGSITSTVSANTTSGFSIVSYTGTGTTATVGHGLGVAPKMIIVKNRNASPAESWAVYHSTLGTNKYLLLNTTDASATSTGMWNNTAPTSTVFSVYNEEKTNKVSTNLIAYCFAEIKGYSKFGSYTGNGSTNGPFVYTGFKPAFIMLKCSSDAGTNWRLNDNKRQSANGSAFTALLIPSTSNAEFTDAPNYDMDFLSNGFKLRVGDIYQNGSGSTYIYMAFAENPFVSSTSIPTTAR